MSSPSPSCRQGKKRKAQSAGVGGGGVEAEEFDAYQERLQIRMMRDTEAAGG